MPRAQSLSEEEIEEKIKEFQEWIWTKPNYPQNLGNNIVQLWLWLFYRFTVCQMLVLSM